MEEPAQHPGHIVTEVMLQVVGAIDRVKPGRLKLGQFAPVEHDVRLARRIDIQKHMLESREFGRELDRFGAAADIKQTFHGGIPADF